MDRKIISNYNKRRYYIPEKPEVITVTKKLEKSLLNRTITDFKVCYEPIIDYPSSSDFLKRIKKSKDEFFFK